MAPPRPPPAGPAVPRRLVLVGGLAASGAALLSRLPGPPGRAAPRQVQVLPAVVESPAGTTAPPAEPVVGHVHDVVVAGGRVLDPDSGYDGRADVGIEGGTITAISPLDGPDGGEGATLRGRTRFDATDRVVAPGFIDILSYDPNPYGVWFKVADGVTTTLGMHGLDGEAGAWFGRWDAEPPPVHHGGAFDHAWARNQLGLGIDQAADRRQRGQLVEMAERGLAEGWSGVHLELEYTPGADGEEVRAMAEVAKGAGAGVYFHGRYSDATPPGTNAETLTEILDVARSVEVAVHVEHLTSTGGTFTMGESLSTLAEARDDGVDVTACMYPYDFWATYLGSARFGPGWEERFGISYDDLVIPGTGERLDARRFAQERGRNTLVAAMAIPEADVVAGLRSPFVMLGSDAVLEPGDNNHPRAAGTFSRVLGRYVRDEGVLDLASALAKMTILPARRLEAAAPAMARKGRLQVGADADITVFDPATVADRADLADPSQESVGIDWVLVGGQAVKTPDGLQRDVLPGRAVRRSS